MSSINSISFINRDKSDPADSDVDTCEVTFFSLFPPPEKEYSKEVLKAKDQNVRVYTHIQCRNQLSHFEYEKSKQDNNGRFICPKCRKEDDSVELHILTSNKVNVISDKLSSQLIKGHKNKIHNPFLKNGLKNKEDIIKKTLYSTVIPLYEKGEHIEVFSVCSEILIYNELRPGYEAIFKKFLNEARLKIDFSTEKAQIKEKLQNIERYVYEIIELIKSKKKELNIEKKELLTQAIVLKYINIGHERQTLAYIYKDIKDYENALEQLKKAKNLFNEATSKKIHKPYLVAFLHLLIGELYLDLINHYEMVNNFLKVVRCYLRAKNEFEKALSNCKEKCDLKDQIQENLEDLSKKFE